MVVATIGATGVFRWLTTQNKASASRLMQSEVYQASAAGLETARSWMVYHAPDVGALIAQYEQGARKPILLDSILRPLANDKKQEFSVYLVGADTKSYPYKLKLISTGKSRGGSKYSQIAILTVDGLYKVQIPNKKSAVDFNYAYFGGSINYAGNNTISSVAINGNWSGNPPTTTGDFVITGNASLTGNQVTVGKNACIGGSLSTNNGFFGNGDLYVVGNTSSFNGTVKGNAYFVGNLGLGNTAGQGFKIEGNLSLDGEMTTNQNSFSHKVSGNLCMDPAAKLTFSGTNNAFEVVGSTWIPGSNSLAGNTTLANAGKQILGSSVTSSMNISNVNFVSGASPFIYKHGTSGTYYNTKSATRQTALFDSIPFPCSLSAKSYCDAFWSKETGCSGASYKIKDPLVTAYSSFESYANNAPCSKDIKKFGDNQSGSNVTVASLNACYINLLANDPDKLYNGFLVVKFSGNGNAEPKDAITGHVIIIYEAAAGTMKIAPTSGDGKVVLYLKNGSGDIIPAKTATGTKYNYFIYSEKDIAQLMNFSETGAQIVGSVYASAENCAKVGNANGNTGLFLDFDPELMTLLSSANVLCANDGSVCGTPNPSDSTSSNPNLGFSGFDSYYIPTSPRLRLSLESQYVNKELDPDTLSSGSFSPLNPSIIVMPRTIYLPKNAKGTLNQYYSVLNLNGATEVQSSGSVSCSPSSGLPTSGDLAGSVGNIYRCEYSPGNAAYNTCPFYVVVDGSEAEKSKISFTEAYTEVTPASNVAVFLKVVDGAQEISTNIQVTIPSGWVVTPKAGVTSIGTNMYQATFTPSAGNSTVHLFDVTVGTSGSTSFTLISPIIGAEPSSPLMQSLVIAGSANIERQGISEYLSKYPAASDTAAMKAFDKYPPCGSYATGVWVDADGIGCTTINANNNWVCGVSNAITLVPKVFPAEACVFALPADANKIDPPEDSKSYTLYADLKRRPYTLTVKSPNAPSKLTLQDSTGTQKGSCSATVSEPCTFQEVFYGNKYKVTVNKVNAEDKFSYWKCLSGSGGECAIPSFSGSTYEIIPLSNDTLIAYFNQRDNCFKETFQGLSENCSGAESQRCIDKCAAGTSCYVNAGAYSTTADWIMTQANNGADFKKPKIVDQVNQKAYLGYGDKPVFILKPVPAGYNGVYSAQIRTYPKSHILSTQSLNTGLVFRSNAAGTSYFSLSVLSKKNDNTNLIRVCYATQPNITDENRCISKGNAVTGWVGTNLDEVKTHTVKATLNGNTLTVSVVDDNGNKYIDNTVFDLSASQFGATGMSANNNEYVGFKLYGDHFRYYNLSWTSGTYGCVDQPQLYCSFRANYAGGRVPLNTPVRPWAYVSNYCETGDASCCTYTFNPTMPRSFSTPGAQGASTVMASASCYNGAGNTLFDAVPCGDFFVGKRTSCAEDVSITADQSCYGAGLCEVLLGSTSNMREASLKLNLTIPSLPDTISVYLVDMMGIQSQAGAYLTASGSYTIPIKDFVDVDMFNPENVSKVLFKSAKGNTFQVKNLYTDCPNSVHISSCVATYEPGKLKFTASVENALSCSISGTGISTISGISCNNPWAYTHDIDLNSGYEGQTGSWTITAYGMDAVALATCATSAEILGVTGACSWSPTTLTSSVAGTSQFTANFSNCPTGGCVYQIKDNASAVVATGTGTTGTANFSTPKPVGTYTYSAHVNGKKLCEAPVKVVAGSPATASCGGVAADGKFTASVTDTDNVGWTWQVIVTDNLGNVLHTSAVSATQTGSAPISYTYSPSVAGVYSYNLKLNGTSVCSSSLTVTGSITNCTITPTTIAPAGFVTFSATTSKIADGKSCVIKHSDGTDKTSGTPKVLSNSCTSSFYPTLSGVYSIFIDGQSRSCGTVTVSSPPGTCACETYCPSAGCSNIITASGSYNSGDNRCLFFTSASKLNIGGSATKINGVLVSNAKSCYDAGACNTNLTSIPKVDGGYYVDLPTWNYLETTITGSNPCLGGPPSSSSVIPSSSSVAPPSSAVVPSSSSAASTISITTATTNIAPGTYSITCSGGGQLICWTTNGEKSFTYNGASCTAYAGEGWGSCGGGTCKAASITTAFPIRCKAGW